MVSGWKHLKTPPLRCRLDSESMTPSPTARPLNPATSHNNNNNNNGGLQACVRAAEDLSLSELLGQNILLLKKYSAATLSKKKIMDNRPAIFVFFLLCSASSSAVAFIYSVQDLCTCSVSSSPFLVNFKRHL